MGTMTAFVDLTKQLVDRGKGLDCAVDLSMDWFRTGVLLPFKVLCLSSTGSARALTLSKSEARCSFTVPLIFVKNLEGSARYRAPSAPKTCTSPPRWSSSATGMSNRTRTLPCTRRGSA